MADNYHVPLDVVCGICAVLSPMNDWKSNLNATNKVLRSKGAVRKGLNMFSRNTDKAMNIYHSLNVKHYLKGPKVERFYINLLNPFDKEACTIDTFMMAAWTGKADKLTISRWNKPGSIELLKKKIWKHARKYGYMPCQAQAIIWLAYHREVKSMQSYGVAVQLNLKIF